MADNLSITPGSGALIGTDDVGGGVQIQRVKLDAGVEGVSTPVNSASPLPTSPINTSTGTYFPQTPTSNPARVVEGVLTRGRSNADGILETRSSVLTDEGTYADPFAGNALGADWYSVPGAGSTIMVANSNVLLYSGTTDNAETYISLPLDYGPFRMNVRVYVSQRIANQDIYIELANGATPASDTQFARFHLNGTDNTVAFCETQSSVDQGGSEGVGIPCRVTNTQDYYDYLIAVSPTSVTFTQAASALPASVIKINQFQIPLPYSFLNFRVRIVNGVSVESQTFIAVDYLRVLNYNEIETRNHSIGDASLSQLVGNDGTTPRLIATNTDGSLSVDISSDHGLALLRRLVKLAETLAVVDSSQRQRVTIDTGVLTTLTTVTSVTNIAGLGGIDPRYQFIDAARTAYGTAIRQNITY